MELLRMSSLYNRTPSELLFIEDEYTGYCLNEACAYIQARIESGDSPRFKTKYKSFAEMYDSYKRR
jgi:hypothetical protein